MTQHHTSAPDLDRVLDRAASAARPLRHTSPATRASWLRAVADSLDAAADTLVPLAMDESHLPETRLRGELARTTFQGRLFAERLESGALLSVHVDHADPDWPMGPRPDIRRTHVPLGPVLVFAASNFPFAFSVAGGDAVSALAAGCPVVLKAHPGHPELSRATASQVIEALASTGAPEGTFALIEGEQAGVSAVKDRRVKAIGFTGSTAGGRALFDLATSRPDPIPFYGELGSTNPVVVTPAGWAKRGAEVATGFAASITLGSGQFCTKPGVVLVPDAEALLSSLPDMSAGPMLNDRIRSSFETSLARLSETPGVEVAAEAARNDGGVRPTLLRTTAKAVIADPSLAETEVFGPAALLVEYASLDEVVEVLDGLGGTLTATVQGGTTVDDDALRVLDLLSEHAGRVIWNEWPTGVTVSDAQQHGGPWPATTAPTTTSVGTAAIHRFLRPIAWQNVPSAGLPVELRD